MEDETRRALREQHRDVKKLHRLTAEDLKKLDSTLKRNQGWFKKVRMMANNEQQSAIIDEAKKLNLSKYVSEVVDAVAVIVKNDNMAAVVALCSLMYELYSDFADPLLSSMLKVIGKQQTQAESNSNDNEKSVRRRVILRLYVELILDGVYSGSEKEGQLLLLARDIVRYEFVKDLKDETQLAGSTLISFLKSAGTELLGIKPKSQPAAVTEAKMKVFEGEAILPRQQVEGFVDLANNCYKNLCENLIKQYKRLRGFEKENMQTVITKGEMSDKQQERTEAVKKAVEKLTQQVTTLSDLLGLEVPKMPEDEPLAKQANSGGLIVMSTRGDNEGSFDGGLFADEATRSFYEDIPDLEAMLPPALLGKKPKKAGDDASSSSTTTAAAAGAPGTTTTPTTTADPPVDLTTPADLTVEEVAVEKDPHLIEMVDPSEQLESEAAKKFTTYLNSLPNCVSKQLIDTAAMDFCYQNTKGTRKRLVKYLFDVPRGSLNLLPYYARLAAVLNAVFNDIGPLLVEMLRKEFVFLLRKHDQLHIESRIRNARFLGELAKFKICMPNIIFGCLQALLKEFVHINVDVCCHLLDTCGRFLYMQPPLHAHMQNFLDIMMRLKKAKTLDNRQDTMIENAYYLCCPPETVAKKQKKERTPVQLYIRKLLFDVLNKNTVDYVVKQLKKLPWEDAAVKEYAIKMFTKIEHCKFSNIRFLASVITHLQRYQPDLDIRVIDHTLEIIHHNLKVNDYRASQQRVSMMKFLAELFNFGLVDSSIILGQFYTLIGLAEDYDPRTDLDYSRVRLACALLEHSSLNLDRGGGRKKVDNSLLFFQLYVMKKHPVPLDVAFMVDEILENLRPTLVRSVSVEQAQQQVDAMLQQSGCTNVHQFLRIQAPTIPPPNAVNNSNVAAMMVEDAVDVEAEERRARALRGEEVSPPAAPLPGPVVTATPVVVVQQKQQPKKQQQQHQQPQQQQQQQQETPTPSPPVDADGEADDEGEEEDDDDDGDIDDEEDDIEDDDDLDDDELEDDEEGEEEDDEGEEGEDEEEEGEEDEDGQEEEDELDPDYKRGEPVKATTDAEDNDFDKELAKAMQENLEERRSEPRSKFGQLSMSVPVSIVKGSSTTTPAASAASAAASSSSPPSSSPDVGPNTIEFRLLFKKGNKQQTKVLNVPKQSALASNMLGAASLKQQQQQENKDLKQRVLRYNDQIVDDTGYGQQKPAVVPKPATPTTTASSTATRGGGGGVGIYGTGRGGGGNGRGGYYRGGGQSSSHQ